MTDAKVKALIQADVQKNKEEAAKEVYFLRLTIYIQAEMNEIYDIALEEFNEI